MCKLIRYFRELIAAIRSQPQDSETDIDDPEKVALAKQLWSAVFDGNVLEVRRLLELGVDVNRRDPEYADTYLHIAITCDNPNIEVVRTLLEFGADTEMRNGPGYTPLVDAITAGRIDIVGALLDYGADIYSYGTEGTTLLEDAVIEEQPEVFKYLLSRGVSPYQRNGDRRNLYEWASEGKVDLTPYFN